MTIKQANALGKRDAKSPVTALNEPRDVSEWPDENQRAYADGFDEQTAADIRGNIAAILRSVAI